MSDHFAIGTRFLTPTLLVEHGIHRAFNVLVETGLSTSRTPYRCSGAVAARIEDPPLASMLERRRMRACLAMALAKVAASVLRKAVSPTVKSRRS